MNAWFPDKKGLASGVLMMGFGASALVIGSTADAIINSPSLGWRGAFRMIGIALGLVLLLAALILKKAPEAGSARKSDTAGEGADLTTAQMLRTLTFWKGMLILIFLAAVGNTVISMAKDLALSVGLAAGAATTGPLWFRWEWPMS